MTRLRDVRQRLGPQSAFVPISKPFLRRRVRDSAVINRAAIAEMFRRNPEDIIVVNHDAALAIKVSFPRPQSSGSKYDSDVYGGQQYAPLLSLPVPD